MAVSKSGLAACIYMRPGVKSEFPPPTVALSSSTGPADGQKDWGGGLCGTALSHQFVPEAIRGIPSGG